MRIPHPPSGVTGPVGEYLKILFRAIDGLPQISKFSAQSPNGNVMGLAGHIAVNMGSESTDSRVWVKGGSSTVPSNTGWNVVRIAS